MLGEHQFQLVAGLQEQFGVSLGTDTYPINAWRRQARAVGFDGDLEACLVKRVNEWLIQLEQRFPAGADDQGTGGGRSIPRPLTGHGGRHILGGRESAAAPAVNADKIGVTEVADSRGSVFLTPRP